MKHLQKHKWTYIIIALACLTRLVGLGSYPGGTYTDEAYGAYASYALMTEGICDRGYPFPVYLVAWGSGMSALYSYMGAILFKIFGVSTLLYRLPQALMSVAGIVAFYALCKELWNEKFACVAALALCLAPVHLMMGRFGLDANMAPNMFVVALAFLVSGLRKKSKYFIPAAIFMGLTLYCYALTWIMVPLFLVMFVVLCYKEILRDKYAWIAVVVLALLALPLIWFLGVNLGFLPEVRTSFFSIPKLTSFRGGELNAYAIKKNIRELWNILIANQTDGGELFNYTSGAFYRFTMPFMFLGGVHHIYTIIKNWKDKKNDTTVIMPLWLIAAAFICIINQHLSLIHINMILIPVIFYGVYGVCQFCALLGKQFCSKTDDVAVQKTMLSKIAGITFTFVWGISFALFAKEYVTKENPMFFGDKAYEAVARAEALAGEEQTITFADYAVYKYPNFIWTKLPDVKEYLANAKFNDDDAFRELLAYENYRYIAGITEENMDESSIYILDKKKIQSFDKLGFDIEKVNNRYAIAYMPSAGKPTSMDDGTETPTRQTYDRANAPKETSNVVILDEGIYQTKAIKPGQALEQIFYIHADHIETISLAFGTGDRTTEKETNLLVEVIVDETVVMSQPLPLMACPENTFLTFAIGQNDMAGKALTIRVTNTSKQEGAAFSMLGTNCIYNFEEYSDGYSIDGEETNESMLLTFGIPAERNKHLDLAYVAWNLAGAFALGAVVRFFYKKKQNK